MGGLDMFSYRRFVMWHGWRPLVVALAVSCVFASDFSDESGEDEIDLQPVGNERLFTFSRDPGKAVLFYGNYGGYGLGRPMFTLYGDGRVVYQDDYGGNELNPKEEEYHLGYNEMEEILRLAVDHGLMDATVESVERKVGRSPYVIDCGASMIAIYLTTYRVNGKERHRLYNRVDLNCPSMLARDYDVEEYHGFRLVGEYLWRLRRVREEQGRRR